MSEDGGNSPRGAIAALVVIVVIVITVLFVVGRLRESAQMQDCLAAGRTNCAPVESDR